MAEESIIPEKPIAILSCNWERTVEWAVNELGVTNINVNNRAMKNKNQRFIVIDEKEQCLSWEFSGYLKAPDYETLEDIVKTRIR